MYRLTRQEFLNSFSGLRVIDIPEGDVCIICGEKYHEEQAVRLPCGHALGEKCILAWLNTANQGMFNNTCPYRCKLYPPTYDHLGMQEVAAVRYLAPPLQSGRRLEALHELASSEWQASSRHGRASAVETSVEYAINALARSRISEAEVQRIISEYEQALKAAHARRARQAEMETAAPPAVRHGLRRCEEPPFNYETGKACKQEPGQTMNTEDGIPSEIRERMEQVRRQAINDATRNEECHRRAAHQHRCWNQRQVQLQQQGRVSLHSIRRRSSLSQVPSPHNQGRPRRHTHSDTSLAYSGGFDQSPSRLVPSIRIRNDSNGSSSSPGSGSTDVHRRAQ